jgi:2-polyprenyl-3-methyl-5-hydroxy-6-metoxy-1,4-benzoquinol methylase
MLSPPPVFQTLALYRAALAARSLQHVRASGAITFVAAPSMIDVYSEALTTVFRALGQGFSTAELSHLRDSLLATIEEAFAEAANARVIVRYEPSPKPGTGLRWTIGHVARPSEHDYEGWLLDDKSPFGVTPDAMVTELARALPAGARCLDIGAGDGRNALSLAREGYIVDAIEPTQAFADQLERTANDRGLRVSVLRARILDVTLTLEQVRYALVVASQIVPHLRGEPELRAFLEKVRGALQPEGILALNAFVPVGGYVPDEMARQYAESRWSSVFTYDEIDRVTDGLGLAKVLDEDALTFERARVLPGTWPPNNWFEGWASGQDVFDLGEPPIRLRWLVFRAPGP